jgi:putative Mn2+ efflux pump MntP
MDLLTPPLIAIGLSMDCFAVSLLIGATTKVRLLFAAGTIALSFGIFQALMTVTGWLAGETMVNLVSGHVNIIAFILLVLVGLKMFYGGLFKGEECVELITPVSVISLSIATSIDAFPAGMTFGILNSRIFVPALIIGFVAFTLSFTGVMAGKRLERIFGNKTDIAGGIILILMGIRFLL